MFSTRVLKVVSKCFKFLTRTQVLHFDWDSERNTMKIRKVFFLALTSRLFCFTNFFYVGFLLFQLYRVLNLPEGQLKVMDIYWITTMAHGHLISAEGLLNPIINKEDWVSFYKEIVQLDKKFDDLDVPDLKRRRERGEKLALYICKGNAFLAISFWSFATMVYLLKPRSPQYLFYGYPEGEGTFAWLLCAMGELYIKGVVMPWGIFIHAWFTVAVAMETTSLTLLRKCSDSLQKKVRLFRCTYLVNRMHNMCYMPSLIPMRLCLFGTFGMEAAVCIILYRDRLTFFELGLIFNFGAGMFLTGVLLLNIAGGVHKNSENLISLLKRERGANKYWNKAVNSLGPFGVSCGPTRAFTFKSMWEFISLVLSGTVSTLVAFKSI